MVFILEKLPGPLQFPLSEAKVEGGLFFFFLQEAWKREMASSFFFQVHNVDSVGMLLTTLNVLTNFASDLGFINLI